MVNVCVYVCVCGKMGAQQRKMEERRRGGGRGGGGVSRRRRRRRSHLKLGKIALPTRAR